MNLRDLQYLVAIAEAGSLARAAELLGVTQPTLSKAVTRLERLFRVKLIERLARGVRLTAYGEVVVSRMASIDGGVRDMFAQLRDLRQGKVGRVTFGVGTGMPPTFVAEAIKPLLDSPDISFMISGARADALVRSVRAGDIEFAVTITPVSKGNLVWEKLFDDPLVPIAPKNHPLLQVPKVSWEELAAARWIVPAEGMASREWFVNEFRKRKLVPPLPVIALDSVGGWPGLGASLGMLALLPASAVDYLPVSALGAIINTPDDWRSDREVGVVYRDDAYLSEAARRLIKSLSRVAKRGAVARAR